MSDIDYDKLSDLVASKLGQQSRPERDKKFLKQFIDAMVEHRSPCHEFSKEEVDSLQGIADRDKKFKKGKFIVTWGIVLYIAKSFYDLAVQNIRWGP